MINLEVDGKDYTLKYSMKRIEMIENATGKPVMAGLQKDKGMLSITDLKIYLAFGMIDNEGIFIPIKKGQEYAHELIETAGYLTINMLVLEAVQRDCPFFFRAD